MNLRQANALQTREKIFNAALNLFIENGFEKVSISDITKEVGTAKGTFYTHFKSKDQVVVEHYKGIDNHYEKVLQNLSKLDSSNEKIMAIFKEGFQYTEKIGKELLRIVLINQISGKEDIPFVMDSTRKIYKILLDLVKSGQQNGEFTLDFDVVDIVTTILQHYSGVFMRWCLLEEKDTLTVIGCHSMQLLLDSFKLKV